MAGIAGRKAHVVGVQHERDPADHGRVAEGVERPGRDGAARDGPPLLRHASARAKAPPGSDDHGGNGHPVFPQSPPPVYGLRGIVTMLAPPSGRLPKFWQRPGAMRFRAVRVCHFRSRDIAQPHLHKDWHLAIQVADTTLRSPVLLAPMAGITDLPFRRLVARFGAGLVVSEMVASQEMVQARPGTRERAELGAGVEGTAVQIAGREAHWMAEAARLVEGMGARIIDINMGCPAKKVDERLVGLGADARPRPCAAADRGGGGRGEGAGHAQDAARLGRRLPQRAEIARRAEAAGVAMITIHGRTRCQFYKGRADWAAIRPVGGGAIPVIANGDIVSTATARAALAASGAAGVMIGRGAQGRPWALAAVAAAAGGPRGRAPAAGRRPGRHGGRTLRGMLAFYGRDLGLRVARKHLGWYMDEAGTPPALRREVLTAPTPGAVCACCPRRSAVSRRPHEDLRRQALGLAARAGLPARSGRP
jgi:tRNA-dihydrouridine synthase B